MHNVRFSLANAECLPFEDESFDCVTIAFGLRNVTDKPAALASMRRVLRPAAGCWCSSSRNPWCRD